jgi:hypothetical protein
LNTSLWRVAAEPVDILLAVVVLVVRVLEPHLLSLEPHTQLL